MPIELSTLDMVERGESHGDAVGEDSIQFDGKKVHHNCVATDQPQASMDQVYDSKQLEEASGPEGLARVKNYDRGFAFYPSFSVERSLTLEFRARRISKLSMEIQALRKQSSSDTSTEPSSVPSTNTVEERLDGMMSQLADSLAQYDSAWVHASIVDNAEVPEESKLDQLRAWLDQKSTGQVGLYRSKEWHEFRMLPPSKGPVEKLVKSMMPLSRLGRTILRPLRSRSVQNDNLRFSRYEDPVLSSLVSVFLLVGICVFLILPLALLSYFDTNRNVRVVLVLVMCFLISIFARIIEADEARQVVFVCVYSAVMSGFLGQSS